MHKDSLEYVRKLYKSQLLVVKHLKRTHGRTFVLNLDSGFEGLCCVQRAKMPRVHTGFYNNFIATLKLIKEHVEPLLAPDQPPRKLYIVGHSLGGGIATLATCYFLLHFDWHTLPHSLVSVTAGSPRVCGKVMQSQVNDRLQYLKGSQVSVYRLVKGKDVVATLPPAFTGFYHVGEAVTIEDDGHIKFHSVEEKNESKDRSVEGRSLNKTRSQMKDMVTTIKVPEETNEKVENEKVDRVFGKMSYDEFMAKIPAPIRDHMPDFYLKPLFAKKGITHGTVRNLETTVHERGVETPLGDNALKETAPVDK